MEHKLFREKAEIKEVDFTRLPLVGSIFGPRKHHISQTSRMSIAWEVIRNGSHSKYRLTAAQFRALWNMTEFILHRNDTETESGEFSSVHHNENKKLFTSQFFTTGIWSGAFLKCFQVMRMFLMVSRQKKLLPSLLTDSTHFSSGWKGSKCWYWN